MGFEKLFENVSELFGPEPCATYPITNFLRIRFYMVTIFGACVAVLSILENLFLVFVLLRRKAFRNSYFVYSIFLGLADIAMSAGYLAIPTVSIAFEYINSPSLMRVWYAYIVPASTLAQVTIMLAPYLLVGASIERLLQCLNYSQLCTATNRKLLILSIISFAVISRGTLFLEIQVRSRPECPGISAFSLTHSYFIQNRPTFALIWCFWYRNLVTCFVPFAALVILNLLILFHRRLRCFVQRQDYNSQRQAKKIGKNWAKLSLDEIHKFSLNSVPLRLTLWARRARKRVRQTSARSLVVIIIEHLSTNVLNLAFSIYEVWFFDHISEEYYNLISDMISTIYVCSCAVHLPTYIVCDATFRQEVLRILTFGTYHPQQRQSQSNINSVASKRKRKSFGLLVGSRMDDRGRRLAISIDEDLINPSPGFSGVVLVVMRETSPMQLRNSKNAESDFKRIL